MQHTPQIKSKIRVLHDKSDDNSKDHPANMTMDEKIKDAIDEDTQELDFDQRIAGAMQQLTDSKNLSDAPKKRSKRSKLRRYAFNNLATPNSREQSPQVTALDHRGERLEIGDALEGINEEALHVEKYTDVCACPSTPSCEGSPLTEWFIIIIPIVLIMYGVIIWAATKTNNEGFKIFLIISLILPVFIPITIVLAILVLVGALK